MQKYLLILNMATKLFFLALIFAFPCNLNAQMFEDESVADTISQQDIKSNETAKINRYRKTNYGAGDFASNKDAKKTVDPKDITVKKLENNTISANEGSIKLYMRDFKISYNLHNSISCSMTFYVYPDINEKINNLAYRLKWPKMETVLSFSNVKPKQERSVKYTLLGKGCYEMDVAPNIIVNRCRVKGLTQQKCSSLIQWIN